MIDFDLAEMYGIENKYLKRSVRNNIERFEGEDFMFELSKEEANVLMDNIRCKIGTLDKSWFRYPPFAFTELGVAMLSSVLNSFAAIQVNRHIMRAFVAVREYLLTRASESVEIAQLRERVLLLERLTDDNTRAINENIEAINDLSEDTGKELETIYDAIGALSVKLPKIEEPRNPVGFKWSSEQR